MINQTGLGYGHYQVTITASYSYLFNHTSNNCYNFYLDAIRIYDPANNGANDETIKNAYLADGEAWPTYQNLRNVLIGADSLEDIGENDVLSGAVFIDGIGSGSASVKDYATFGPNNELYLAPGQAITFELPKDGTAEAVRVALKSVGGTAKVKIYNTLMSQSEAKEKSVNTASELYYDISDLQGAQIAIYNCGSSSDAILSITNLKTTYNVQTVDAGAYSVRTTSRGVMQTLTSLGYVVKPVITPAYPTLAFEDEIRYNVYYTVDDPGSVGLEDMGLITFDSRLEDGTMEDAVSIIPGATGSDGMYCVHTNGIPAKNMGDSLYFKIYAKLSDGSYVYSDVLGYNAVLYANTILSGSEEAAKALVVAMLEYGVAAQEYFGYNTDNLMKPP